MGRRKTSDPPSICVTPYPQSNTICWRNEKIEKDQEFVQTIVHGIRSARSDYNIPNKIRADVYLVCSGESGAQSVVEGFLEAITTLSFSSKVECNASPPSGCVIISISASCQAHLQIKGLIDIEKETLKLQQKK